MQDTLVIIDVSGLVGIDECKIKAARLAMRQQGIQAVPRRPKAQLDALPTPAACQWRRAMRA